MSTALFADSKFYGPELLQISDAVAREKGLSKDIVLEAMEEAIQKAAKTKYGPESDIRVNIDRKTGEVSLTKCITVKDIVEDEMNEVTLAEAKKMDPKAEIGTVFSTKLPPINFGRVAVQLGRQAIFQKIHEAEREKQYNELKDKAGEIINGVVKRAEFNSVTLDIGRTEAVIRRDQLIPKENFRVGDRVRAYITEVRREVKGPQVFLSRTHPQFLAKLFAQEVPEIYEGIIEIKSVARDPGSRAKIAVFTSDPNVDPIGACVGVRGSRVQAIIQELQGEKIDIVWWSDNPATFAVNALAPAEVSRVILDEDNHKFEVLVPENQLSLAIGRRGQNVRLASMLTGWDISVVSEAEAIERRNKEYHEKSKAFMDALECDEVIAHLLVNEGFLNAEELSEESLEDLASIEGFDENIAGELLNRAKAYMQKKRVEQDKQLRQSKVEAKLMKFDKLTKEELLALADKGIKKLDNLADLSVEELIELLPDLSKDRAEDVIMKAREHWFK